MRDGVSRTNENTDKGETFLAKVKAVDLDKDNWERFEPDVEEAVNEGYVEVEEEDYGFKVQSDRADQGDENDLWWKVSSRHGLEKRDLPLFLSCVRP